MSNSERINIKDLTLEEPPKKKELPFDPERDLTEEDKGNLKKELEENIINHSWVNALENMSAYNALFPDEIESLILDDTAWLEIKRVINFFQSTKQYRDFNEMAVQAKLAFPKQSKEIVLDDTTYQESREYLGTCAAKKLWWAFGQEAMKIKILFPEKSGSLLQVENITSNEIWDGMKKELERMIDLGLRHFCQHAAAMKILFPYRISELSFDTAFWKQAHKELSDYRDKEFWRGLFQEAVAMKLLAAEEINITDQGLEVIMQKEKPEFKEETPPMPKTRKF